MQAGALGQGALFDLYDALGHLVHPGEGDGGEDGGGEDKDGLAEADSLLQDLDDGRHSELAHAGARRGDPGGQSQVPVRNWGVVSSSCEYLFGEKP